MMMSTSIRLASSLPLFFLLFTLTSAHFKVGEELGGLLASAGNITGHNLLSPPPGNNKTGGNDQASSPPSEHNKAGGNDHASTPPSEANKTGNGGGGGGGGGGGSGGVNASLQINASFEFNGSFKGSFSKVFAFGGSDIDTGNAYLLGVLRNASSLLGPPPVRETNGRLSNGRLVVDFLCDALSLPEIAPYKAASNSTSGSSGGGSSVNGSVSGGGGGSSSVNGSAGGSIGGGGGGGSGNVGSGGSGNSSGSVGSGGSGSGSSSGNVGGGGSGSGSGSGSIGGGSGSGSIGGSGSGSGSIGGGGGSGSVDGGGGGGGSINGSVNGGGGGGGGGSGSGSGSGGGSVSGGGSGSGSVSGGSSGSGSVSGGGSGSGSLSGSGGLNFAVAGSTALPKDYFSNSNLSSQIWKGVPQGFQTQVEWFNKFLADAGCKASGRCNEDIANSLFWVGEMGVSDFISAIGSSLAIPQITEISVRIVCEILKSVLDNGAKYIVVQGLPPLGCFPAYISSSSSQDRDDMGCAASANIGISSYNEILQMRLQKFRKMYPHCQIVYADYWNAYLTVLKDPKKFDIEEPFKSCCDQGGGMSINRHSLFGSSKSSSCKDPQKHITWDGIHLTESMNKKITALFLNEGFCKPPFNELVKTKLKT